MNPNDLLVNRPRENDLHHQKDILGCCTKMHEGYISRVNVLAQHFAIDRWSDVTVMDIGCGQGGFGLEFAKRGAQVIYVDGRESNLEALKRKSPDAKIILHDLESGKSIPHGKVDVALFMGALYHVGKPIEVMEVVAQTSDNLCVETACMDHDGEAVLFFQESTDASTFSVTGGACRPSPKWVERLLPQLGFLLLKDISCSELNVPTGEGFSGLVYDWEFQRTCGWRRNEHSLRRMWIASREARSSCFRELKS